MNDDLQGTLALAILFGTVAVLILLFNGDPDIADAVRVWVLRKAGL